jgi:hypothetical protein
MSSTISTQGRRGRVKLMLRKRWEGILAYNPRMARRTALGECPKHVPCGSGRSRKLYLRRAHTSSSRSRAADTRVLVHSTNSRETMCVVNWASNPRRCFQGQRWKDGDASVRQAQKIKGHEAELWLDPEDSSTAVEPGSRTGSVRIRW